MGKTFLGGYNQGPSLLTPEQESYLSSAMGGMSQMGQPMNPKQFQEMFRTSFVDPSKQMMERQIIPGIKEQFMGLDETGSSALNQALAQSATDLSTALGSQLMNQYNIGQNRQLQALSGLGGLSTQNTFPLQQQQGILGPLINATGQLAAGMLGLLI